MRRSLIKKCHGDLSFCAVAVSTFGGFKVQYITPFPTIFLHPS